MPMSRVGSIEVRLIRLLGDFELAEEAMQEAFAAALIQWPRDGLPAKPRAWLVSTGRFKAIDRLRRNHRHDELLREHPEAVAPEQSAADFASLDLPDDRLRLIFTCCHPALAIRFGMAWGKTVSGKADFKTFLEKMDQGATGVSLEIANIIVEGDRTVVDGKISMTDRDGQRRVYAFCDVYRLAGGKVAELTAYVQEISNDHQA